MNPNHPLDADRFHLKREPCPHCGDEPTFNKALASVALNAHLHGQVAQQREEVRQVKDARREWNG